MKLIKLGIFSVVILFLITTLIGLMFPSKAIVSRTIDINKSADAVYYFINNLNGWQKWIKTLESGSIISTTKAKIGNSEIIIDNSTIKETNGRWVEQNGNVQTTSIKLIAYSQNQTIVNWQFEENIKWYPWKRFGSFLNEKIIGKMMEENLSVLKKVAEKN